MKHRIKVLYNYGGKYKYIPQYKYLFLWFTYSDNYSNHISFFSEKEAINFIKEKLNYKILKKYKKYIYPSL